MFIYILFAAFLWKLCDDFVLVHTLLKVFILQYTLNINYYTPRNELRRVKWFWPIRQSISQSVSPVFLVSATPLKPLDRITWNCIDMKDVMCRCAYLQDILIQVFCLGVTPFFNFEIWPKWKILLKQFVSATPLKPLNRISWIL